MQFIFDNLSAILIAGVLFLILVAVNHRTRVAAVESSNYYALKQQQLSFVEMLKRDMQNVTELQSITEDPMTLEFRFRARTNPADANEHDVLYRRESAGEQEGKTVYQIKRYVDGSSDGGSMATMVSWTIIAQNEQGVQVTDVNNARQVFLRFEALNPFEKGETIANSQWETTFRPPLLQQATSI